MAIERIEIEIDWDTVGIERAFKDTDLIARETKKRLEAPVILQFQGNIIQLKKQIDKAKKELKQARARWDLDAEVQLEVDLDVLNKELKKSRKELKNLETTGDKAISSLDRKFDKLWAWLSSRFRNIWASILGAFWLTSWIDALADWFRASFGLAVDYERQLVRVWRIANATESEFKKLEEVTQELWKTTEFTANQSAQAFEFLALAWLNVEQAIAAIPATLNLALAWNLDLARSADIATNIMAQFRIEAKDTWRVVDVLAKLQSNANTNIEEASEAFKFLWPIVWWLWVSLEDTATFIWVLANNGLKGSIWVRSFGSALGRLADETSPAAEALAEIWVSAFDSQWNFVWLLELLDEVKVKTKDLSEEAKLDVIKRAFWAEAIKSVLSFINTTDEWINQLNSSLKDAEWFAKWFADEIAKTDSGQIKELKSIWEDVGIAVWEALADFLIPLAKRATEVLAPLIKNMVARARENPWLAKWIAWVVWAWAGLVALLVWVVLPLKIIGSLLWTWWLISSIGWLSTAFASIWTVLSVWWPVLAWLWFLVAWVKRYYDITQERRSLAEQMGIEEVEWIIDWLNEKLDELNWKIADEERELAISTAKAEQDIADIEERIALLDQQAINEQQNIEWWWVDNWDLSNIIAERNNLTEALQIQKDALIQLNEEAWKNIDINKQSFEVTKWTAEWIRKIESELNDIAKEKERQNRSLTNLINARNRAEQQIQDAWPARRKILEDRIATQSRNISSVTNTILALENQEVANKNTLESYKSWNLVYDTTTWKLEKVANQSLVTWWTAQTLANDVASWTAQVSSSVSEMSTNVQSELAQTSSAASTEWWKMTSNLASWIQSWQWEVIAAADTVWNSFLSRISSLTSKAIAFWRKLIRSFSAWINWEVANAWAAAWNVTEEVADYIAVSSPTKKWALAVEQSIWGKNLIEEFAKGVWQWSKEVTRQIWILTKQLETELWQKEIDIDLVSDIRSRIKDLDFLDRDSITQGQWLDAWIRAFEEAKRKQERIDEEYQDKQIDKLEELKEVWEDVYDSIWDSIEAWQEKVDELIEKISDWIEEISRLEDKIWNIEQDRQNDLAERYIEVQEEIKEARRELEELNQAQDIDLWSISEAQNRLQALRDENELLKQNTTEKERQSAVEFDALSETEKILENSRLEIEAIELKKSKIIEETENLIAETKKRVDTLEEAKNLQNQYEESITNVLESNILRRNRALDSYIAKLREVQALWWNVWWSLWDANSDTSQTTQDNRTIDIVNNFNGTDVTAEDVIDKLIEEWL